MIMRDNIVKNELILAVTSVVFLFIGTIIAVLIFIGINNLSLPTIPKEFVENFLIITPTTGIILAISALIVIKIFNKNKIKKVEKSTNKPFEPS